MCERVRDRVSVLHCVAVRHALHVAVSVGNGLTVADDLVDALELVHVVWDELQQLVGQRVGLADVVAVVVCERVRDRVGVLHRVAVRHAVHVAVGLGHALDVADDLDVVFVVADRIVIV